MSKVLKILIGATVVSAAVAGAVVIAKVVHDNRQGKSATFDNADDFVRYITAPEDAGEVVDSATVD